MPDAFPPMIRWTFRILFCLLLGVVTTVGVAWGLAVFTCVNNFEAVNWRDDGSYYDENAYYREITAGWTGFAGYHAEIFFNGPTKWPEWDTKGRPYEPDVTLQWGALRHPPPQTDAERDVSGVWYWAEFRFAAGWPALCLYSTQRERIGDLVDEARWGLTIDDSSDALRSSPYFNPHRVLPLRPIFPGFLINTLFYAAIWFMLIFGWCAHMRVIRRWEGHCPMCNYDLRGDLDGGCPECGWRREK